MISTAFDLILAFTIVLLADATLRQRSASEAVVQFMVFGLITSIAWVRIEAPDLALTEAAIGTGVTGALLLATLRKLGMGELPSAYVSPWIRFPVELGCIVLGCLLSWIVLMHWPTSPGLTQQAYEALPESGLKNPVTAVVLNYRAWDTLLEMVVLWIAAIAASIIHQGSNQKPEPASPIFSYYLVRIIPFASLTIVYLIWIGARAPGGAFPAGALLGGMGVLLLLGPTPPRIRLSHPLVRTLLVLGVLVFSLVAVGMLYHGALLEFPKSQAKRWITAIEFACTLSIGLSFIVLFASCSGILAKEKSL